jgi:hydroxyquinol 1,2-dioxygenase
MRNINLDNITGAAVASFAGLPGARQRELVQTLVQHLHQYARDVKLTHEEWRGALAFLHRVGEISSESRSEFTLLSDVSGLSSLVDLLATDPAATPGSVLGPFHTAGSPWLPNPVEPHRRQRRRARAAARTRDERRRPAPDGRHAGFLAERRQRHVLADGLRSQPTDNLRCQLQVDADGGFEIATIRAVPYRIPTDGPVWTDLVEPAGRSAWRPAHFHLIVSAPGHRTLVTELFDAEDPYLDDDAVFGVRDALVGRYEPITDAAACARLGIPGSSCLAMQVTLRLVP